MNFQDLLTKISALDQPVGESMQPPVQAVMATASGPATPEITGDSGHLELDEKGAMECGPEMTMPMAPKQPDNVDMNVTMHGQGPNGIRSLMDILRNLDKGAVEPHDDDTIVVGVEQAEPQHEPQDDDALFGEIGEDGEYGNRPDPEVADITNVLPKGNDLLGSRRKEPPKPAGGGNPYPMNEALVAKLQAHYDSLKDKIRDKYNKYDESALNEWGVNLSQPYAYNELDAPKAYNDEANVNAMWARYNSLIEKTRQEIAQLEADPSIGGQPQALKMAKDQLAGLQSEKLHNLTGTGTADATNALRKQAIANNELTPGQWLQKATQYFNGKVTGQPQPGVSYDRIDTTKKGEKGYSTSTPYTPESINESADILKLAKILRG